MRPALIFQCLLVCSLVGATQAFGLDLIMGAVGGLAKGVISGSMGAFAPIAKDGLGSMLGFLTGGMDSAGDLANQGMGGLGSAVNQGSSALGGLGDMFSGMLSSWMNLMQEFMGAGGSLASALFGMLRSAFSNFFGAFGQLSGNAQAQIGNMYRQTGTTFNAVMKLKLNPAKNQKLIQREMQAAKKVMETHFDHPTKFFAAMHHHAPQLTAATKLAFNRASQEFQKHHKTLNPEAKKGAANMHLQLAQAKFGIGSLLGPLSGLMGGGGSAASSGFSMFLSIIKNIMSMMTGLF
ncbi:hypothetical protein M3Y99_01574800 [Aphelenchoides fujianensis]|nr:hypothetical protein M3Y99_01574800 [Aphelenchoides fujianensis]